MAGIGRSIENGLQYLLERILDSDTPKIDLEEEIVIYRCVSCGKIDTDLSRLHGHVDEKHTPDGSSGNIGLMLNYTQKITVRDYEKNDTDWSDLE